jgi:hypothetical protein
VFERRTSTIDQLRRLLVCITHDVEGNHGVCECGAGAHLGSDPDRLHHLALQDACAQSRLGMSSNAVGALSHVRGRDGDELLRLRIERAGGEDRPAEPWNAFSISGASSSRFRERSALGVAYTCLCSSITFREATIAPNRDSDHVVHELRLWNDLKTSTRSRW